MHSEQGEGGWREGLQRWQRIGVVGFMSLVVGLVLQLGLAVGVLYKLEGLPQLGAGWLGVLLGPLFEVWGVCLGLLGASWVAGRVFEERPTRLGLGAAAVPALTLLLVDSAADGAIGVFSGASVIRTVYLLAAGLIAGQVYLRAARGAEAKLERRPAPAARPAAPPQGQAEAYAAGLEAYLDQSPEQGQHGEPGQDPTADAASEGGSGEAQTPPEGLGGP